MTLTRGAWLALGLSLAVHTLCLVLLGVLSSRPTSPEPGPLIDTVVCLVEDPESVVNSSASNDPPASETFVAETPVAQPPAAPASGPIEPPVDPQPTETGTSRSPEPVAAVPASAPSGGGGPGGPTFFQVPVQGQTVVYVIDRSLSMGLRGGLNDAKRELLASLEQLPETAQFQILFYNRETSPLLGGRGRLVPATEEMKRSAGRLLDTLRAAGSTNHLQALQQALDLEPDVLFLVTDADDLTTEQIRTVTQRNHDRTVIHTIQLGAHGSSEEGGALSLLAHANHGTFHLIHLAGS